MVNFKKTGSVGQKDCFVTSIELDSFSEVGNNPHNGLLVNYLIGGKDFSYVARQSSLTETSIDSLEKASVQRRQRVA